MAPTPPKKKPVKKKPVKKKPSSLAAYAAGLKVTPATNTKKDGKGNSVIPRGGLNYTDAPDTPLGRYANRLVPERGRTLTTRGGYTPGQRVAGEGGNPLPSLPGVGVGGGSWFQNLGKDALSIVTGLPGTIALAGRTAASVPLGVYGNTAGRVGAPGGGAARGFAADTGADLLTAGKATVDDFKDRYGPFWDSKDVSALDLLLDRGDSRERVGAAIDKVKEHPGFFALDVASVASLGAGGAVKAGQVGARAGKRVTSNRLAREPNAFPNNTPPPRASGAGSKNPRLQPAGPTRPRGAGRIERALTSPSVTRLAESRKLANRKNVRQLSVPVQAFTPRGATEPVRLASGKTTVDRRTLSPNPVTRNMQLGIQRTTDRLLEGVGNRAAARAPKSLAAKFSTAARDQRFVAKDARRHTVKMENKRDQRLHEVTKDFERDVLYKREISKDKRKEALINLIHDNIAVPKGAKSASARLSAYIATAEAKIAKRRANGEPEESLEAQQKNIDLMKSIPAEMVDNPPEAVVKGAAYTREVLRESQSIRERMGGVAGIRGNTRARAGAYREAVGVAGARFYEDVGAIIHPERRDKIIADKGYEHVPAKVVAQAARKLYTEKIGAGNANSADLRRAAELIDAGLLPARGSAQAERMLASGGPDSLYNQVAAALDKKFGDGVPVKSDGTIDTTAVAEKIREQGARGERVLEDLLNDPDNLFPLGEKASPDGEYRASLPVGFASGHKDSQTSFGLGEMGSTTARTTGSRIEDASDSLSRETTMVTIQRALNAFYTKESVRTTMNDWALKAEGSNKPYVFREADAARELDAERWTLIDVQTLERVVADLGDAADPDGTKISAHFDDRDAVLAKIGQKDSQVVALPTVLVKEIRKTIDDPNGLLRRYDSAMNVWRAGILAYTPRWFVNNILGTSVFLGVMSGLDFKAFKQASMDGKFFRENVIPERATSTSHSNAIGKADEGRGGLEPQAKSRFMRGAHTMFRLNERLEGRLRRAAYISRAKQSLRQEGRLRPRNYGKKLTDDELFDAMVRMPDDLKEQTLKDMEFFVGQYKSFGNNEKRVMRRVIPFYSWLRVINTWAFGLPFKSPIRAEALRIGTTATAALAEDTDGLPLWEKGRLTFGKFALRTNNINPLFSVAEEISAVTGGSGASGLTELFRVAGGSMSPPLQYAIGQISGRNPFGTRDFTAPLGQDGSLKQFGRQATRRNPVTGEIENYVPSPDPLESAFDSIVPFAASLRQGIMGERQAYDNASTIDLIANMLRMKPDSEVYQPPAITPSGRSRLPNGLGTISALAGAPIYRVDKAQETKANLKKEIAQLEAERETMRGLIKEAIRRGER